jgi:hypothetical protein
MPGAHPPSVARSGRCVRRSLGPGCPAAPGRNCLALLPPGPDAVRKLPVRGTWPSTLAPERPFLERLPLWEGVQPRYSGLRVQGTASSPPSATGPFDASTAVTGEPLVPPCSPPFRRVGGPGRGRSRRSAWFVDCFLCLCTSRGAEPRSGDGSRRLSFTADFARATRYDGFDAGRGRYEHQDDFGRP